MKLEKGTYVVKVDDGTHIYGMKIGKLYKLLGYHNGGFIIENESGELISVHPERATEVYIEE